MTRLGPGRGAAVLLLLLSAAGLPAGEPVLRNVNLRGLQIGATTTIVCDGDDFGAAPALLLPFAARQELRKGASDKQATFDVELDNSIVPGLYQLRIVSAQGVSQPAIIAVDRLPQRAATPMLDELPVAVHGSVGGSAVVETRFHGKSGQKVMIDVESQRLGSKLRPVVHLHSPRRLQVAWGWTTPAHFGDARLEATLPEDGQYTITLHDMEYATPAPGFFRMKVGAWSSVDRVFPPVIARGQEQAIELLGRGSDPNALRVKLPPVANAPCSPLPLAWPGKGLWSGARPFVSISPHAELLEQPGAKPQELPAGVVGVSGRLQTPHEEDRYRVPVTSGTKVRLEVFAERLGAPVDVALVVRNEAGGDVARAEDSPGTLDPLLEYAVPDKVTAIVVAIVDAQGRGGPGGIYHLVVEPQLPAPQSDFRLITTAPTLTLPPGGRDVMPVMIERRGYRGAIELSADTLPPGVRLDGATIPPEADGALVTAHRDGGASTVALTSFVGRGAGGERRPVTIKGHPLERLQPWLATEIAVAPSSTKVSEFQIDWRGLPEDAVLVPSKKLALPVTLTRPADNSVVKLTLLTSQRTPLVNNQPDPNKALRAEKPVELDAKARESEMTLLVPTQLEGPVFDVAVQAELLTPDKKTVKAVSFAPVRRMPVRLPLVVKLDGPPRLEATLDVKQDTTVKLAGQVERLEGVTGDVALTLTGLPTGARADAVNLRADAKSFAFNIILPPSVAPAEVKNVKLSGALAPDAKQPNIRLRSRDVELTLVVKAAPK